MFSSAALKDQGKLWRQAEAVVTSTNFKMVPGKAVFTLGKAVVTSGKAVVTSTNFKMVPGKAASLVNFYLHF